MKRFSSLHRSTTPIRRRKPIPKVNVERQKKRRMVYTSFLKSAAWKAIRKAAIERAGNRCEQFERIDLPAPFAGILSKEYVRCSNTENLTVDHKTYARFGGRECPSDLQVLCRFHHNRKSALTGKRKSA